MACAWTSLLTLCVGLARSGKRARLLYTIPTFHNPTGVNLSLARRQAVIDLAVQHDLLIIEDDVYRELAYDGPALPSLFSMAPRGTVMRLGSFAKSLAPGLRLGWLHCSAAQARRLADGGLRDSGGTPSYAIGMMVSALCHSGDYDAHVRPLARDVPRAPRCLERRAHHAPAGGLHVHHARRRLFHLGDASRAHRYERAARPAPTRIGWRSFPGSGCASMDEAATACAWPSA